MLKNFHTNFGITSSIEQEQDKFINRVNVYLKQISRYSDNYSDNVFFTSSTYTDAFYKICYYLGVDPGGIKNDNYFSAFGGMPTLDTILPKGFLNTLKILSAIYYYFKESDYSEREEICKGINDKILDILDQSTISLGIKYDSGTFYPEGEKLLDRELIEVALTALKEYPNENKDLRNALNNFQSGPYDVINNCYKCMEGFLRNILKNNKTLIDNKGEILKLINLTD